MSLHSYARIWINMTWGTLNRERVITKESAKVISNYLYEYAKSNSIFMKKNFVNTDHVHVLFDLPTGQTIEKVAQLLKGSSSHYINENKMVHGGLTWARGYGAFSVSHSMVSEVVKYISEQEVHHKRKTFTEEFEAFLRAYQLDNPAGSMMRESR